MSNKYIIKNCPCYDHEYEECLNTFRDEYKKCYDCTDCVMKQIVKLLKSPNNCRYSGKPLVFTDNILALLDIQEISK